MRRSQKEVKSVLHPRGQSSILHIEVPADDGTNTVKKIVEQEEMEHIMMKNFKSKFLEVYDTPIPHAPFNQWLGQIGLGPGADKILDVSPRHPSGYSGIFQPLQNEQGNQRFRHHQGQHDNRCFLLLLAPLLQKDLLIVLKNT